MDEYIKREEALNALLNGMVGTGYQSRAMDAIKFIPSADVVPKSEVDLYKRQVDELEDELAQTYDKLEAAKTEVAREIFDEIGKATASVYNDFMFSRESIGANATAVVIFSDELDIAIDNLKDKYTKGGGSDV